MVIKATDLSPIPSTDSEKARVYHVEDAPGIQVEGNVANALYGLDKPALFRSVEQFVDRHGLDKDMIPLLERGALAAQNSTNFEDITELHPDELDALRNERDHRWSHPMSLYLTVALCSIGACVQGWDQTGSNGANLSFPVEFGIPITNAKDPNYEKNNWIVGLVNSAPYIAAFTCSAWLADPANHYLGRRGTLFMAAIFCFLAPIGSAFTQSWGQLFACRFLLGFGVGFKEVAAPVLAAENAPARIRGSLTTSWQIWVAFGILLGYSANLAVYKVGKIAWRLQLGSAMIPAIPLLLLVWFVPESPRWHMKWGRMEKAYKCLLRLRKHRILAARDLFYMATQIEAEEKIMGRSSVFKRFCELFYKNRIRQATLASSVIMAARQMSGINIMAFFSSSVFKEATGSTTVAMWASWGFGAINWLFALPALYTIDHFGRRFLLMFTYPHMIWTLVATGCAALATNEKLRLGLMATFIYLYTIAYSPGEGPVPFVYASETFPVFHREIGMAWSITVNNFLAAVLSLTWFRMKVAFGTTGAFCFYAGLNCISLVLLFLFMPETKQLSLEELDRVFSIPTKDFVDYQCHRALPYFIRRYIKGDKSAHLVPLLEVYPGDPKEFRATEA